MVAGKKLFWPRVRVAPERTIFEFFSFVEREDAGGKVRLGINGYRAVGRARYRGSTYNRTNLRALRSAFAGTERSHLGNSNWTLRGFLIWSAARSQCRCPRHSETGFTGMSAQAAGFDKQAHLKHIETNT